MSGTITTPPQDAAAAFNESVYATLTQRFFAYVLDIILTGLLCIVLLSQIVVPVDLVPVVFPSCFMLYRFLAHFTVGATVGKYIMGIEVVQEPDKRMPRVVAMLLRDTVGFIISSALFGLGYWWGALSLNGKAWSDILAGTIVRERRKG
jgi:uncharacterized RDD family membrane protein YckC